MTRRQYSREFKIEAVRLVTGRGVSVAQAARDLDVHATVVRRWVREFGTDEHDVFPGHGQLKPDDEEIRRLKREVVKLSIMNWHDLLKHIPTSIAI